MPQKWVFLRSFCSPKYLSCAAKSAYVDKQLLLLLI